MTNSTPGHGRTPADAGEMVPFRIHDMSDRKSTPTAEGSFRMPPKMTVAQMAPVLARAAVAKMPEAQDGTMGLFFVEIVIGDAAFPFAVLVQPPASPVAHTGLQVRAITADDHALASQLLHGPTRSAAGALVLLGFALPGDPQNPASAS